MHFRAISGLFVKLQIQYFRSPISHKLAIDRKYPFHPRTETNKIAIERICCHSVTPKTFRTIEFE